MLGDPHQRSFPITVTASKFVYGLRSLIDAIPNSNIVLAYIRSIGPNFFGVIYIVANLCIDLWLAKSGSSFETPLMISEAWHRWIGSKLPDVMGSSPEQGYLARPTWSSTGRLSGP
ncbi:uncharacterized protein PGTG_05835 [Puccinia graminis f. sp. tritici CRL 75-36-700-3]|uniref:Uncharacterized protein n=1 Tax=Puccinia graminis f. sp. tritici (strain CRL 75-36-700-3 / race SCCL) TaxID=418459 RepID=E3K5U3_PUCGT|nr:uncharacterized protein PGTG_05835 [Puccinia graminis f. sp. tritici CRL 75-36-700-3]EFP79514.1 hypothetical protein PGTG_05835 [Puccinia graminis f. sp. tritici CRL 75-36-700-3]